jgi:hypothetical protein
VNITTRKAATTAGAALIGAGAIVAGTQLGAFAHTKAVTVDCEVGLTVNLTRYADPGRNQANTYTVDVDDDTVAEGSFRTDKHLTAAPADLTEAWSYRVVVQAWDDPTGRKGYSFDTGVVPVTACPKPTPTPTPSETVTPPPPTPTPTVTVTPEPSPSVTPSETPTVTSTPTPTETTPEPTPSVTPTETPTVTPTPDPSVTPSSSPSPSVSLTPTTITPTTSSTTAPPAIELAHTGANTWNLAGFGALLVLIGAGVVAFARNLKDGAHR